MKDQDSFDIIVTLNSHKINPDQLIHFVENGATFFRLNGAFLSLKTIEEDIREIRGIAEQAVKIIIDLPGYKMRFSHLQDKLQFAKDVPFRLDRDIFNYPEIVDEVKPGTIIRINDGRDKLVVKEVKSNAISCIAGKSGEIRRGKGMHFDSISYRPSTSSLSDLDCALIEVAHKNEVDYVGLSFVHDYEDIKYVRNKLKGTNVKCIPKIESKESINNIDEILGNSEKIIIDRGDLAGEIGLENIWKAQRDIISQAKVYGTNVIVATQILSGMINNPIPTIAEVDSLYSLLDCGIDGIQLSDETCIGDYAEEAILFIRDVIEKERDLECFY